MTQEIIPQSKQTVITKIWLSGKEMLYQDIGKGNINKVKN